jgi:hypothetical protein
MKAKLCPCGATILIGQPHACHVTRARECSKRELVSRSVDHNNRYTVQRVGSAPSPYLPFKDRCMFAVETVRSINVPTPEQCTELELMFGQDEVE